MPIQRLSNFVLFSDLVLDKIIHIKRHQGIYLCHTRKTPEVCPCCANLCDATYDHRKVRIQDAPIRGSGIVLIIRKRRLWCPTCRKPFTEPIEGILPGRRKTQRFRRSVAWACENFSDLKKVRRAFNCSNDFIYTAFYEQLEIKQREQFNNPWPKSIGLDEHSFKRSNPGSYGYREFVTMIVDHKNKKLFDVVHGKTGADLHLALTHKQGRENVRWATIDMCDPYKNFIRNFFPNAQIVADKFHVLRLLNADINRARKQITGDKRTNPVRKLLLRSSHKLSYFERSALSKWLAHHDEIREIYTYKEALHKFYRIKGYDRAKRALIAMTDAMALSNFEPIKRLRRTLMKWRNEILNYFKNPITNARVEGFIPSP
jgi:transposase